MNQEHEIAVIKKDSNGLSKGLSAIASGPTINDNGTLTVTNLNVSSTLTYTTLQPVINQVTFGDDNTPLTKIEYNSTTNRLTFFNGDTISEFQIGPSVIPDPDISK